MRSAPLSISLRTCRNHRTRTAEESALCRLPQVHFVGGWSSRARGTATYRSPLGVCRHACGSCPTQCSILLLQPTAGASLLEPRVARRTSVAVETSKPCWMTPCCAVTGHVTTGMILHSLACQNHHFFASFGTLHRHHSRLSHLALPPMASQLTSPPTQPALRCTPAPWPSTVPSSLIAL